VLNEFKCNLVVSKMPKQLSIGSETVKIEVEVTKNSPKAPEKARWPIERVIARLLNAAIDFCESDAEVQKARRQRTDLIAAHDLYDGICLAPREPFDDFEGRDALPRSQWCQYCRDFFKKATSYPSSCIIRQGRFPPRLSH
jgi:hypothetical protein